MAINRSILELITSPFGSESMKYCSSRVILEAKLPDQKFFRNLCQCDFDSAAPPHAGQSDQHGAWVAESKLRWRHFEKTFGLES